MTPVATRVLERLSSLALTVPGIVALALAVLVSYRRDDVSVWWLLGPLLWLAVNLCCAIVVNRVFRVRHGLLVFHIGLLLVTVLVGLSQLLGYSARIELAQGQSFAVESMQLVRRGPWSNLERIRRVQLRQVSFVVAYHAGLVRAATTTRVKVNAAEMVGTVSFGDAQALDLDDHRFYSTSNKGFAAELRWSDTAGDTEMGAVHFPSYPLNDWRQLNSWRTPAGQRLELELVIDRRAPVEQPWLFDDNALSWVRGLRVRGADSATVRLLAPGESIALTGGRLHFERPLLWMGYRIVHQPFLGMILASALIAVAGLAWHVMATMLARTAVPAAVANGVHDV